MRVDLPDPDGLWGVRPGGSGGQPVPEPDHRLLDQVVTRGREGEHQGERNRPILERAEESYRQLPAPHHQENLLPEIETVGEPAHPSDG